MFYDVTITETLEEVVNVYAESREDAERKVREAYHKSVYILDAENFTGVTFSATGRDVEQASPSAPGSGIRPHKKDRER